MADVTKLIQFNVKAVESLVKRKLEMFGMEANFFSNRHAHPEVFHYIITEIGSSEILAWGQKYSLKEAESRATECMQKLAAKQKLVV